MLGAADVDDTALATMVSDTLGVGEVEVLDCQVDIVDYDIEALTTASRYWVRGAARHADGQSPYASSSRSCSPGLAHLSSRWCPRTCGNWRPPACPGAVSRWSTAPTWANACPSVCHCRVPTW